MGQIFLWTFPLLLLMTSIVGEVVVPRTNSVNPNDLDNLVWRYILDKYSTSGQSLTSEDVEKLVNSLRNNKCDGNKNKKSDSLNSCMGIPLLEWGKQFNNLTSLNDVCHKILFFVDNPTCCDAQLFPQKQMVQDVQDDQGMGNGNNEQLNQPFFISAESKHKGKEKPSSGEVWGYGILCVTLISLCSLIGVSVMPFMKKTFYKHLLTALVGLGVGSLIGSAAFHLIPQAFGLADHDPNHDYLFISLVLCGGIWLFFMVERILKFIMDYKDRKAGNSNWKREKIPSVVSSTPENSTISMLVENGNCIKSPQNEGRLSLTTCGPREPGVIYECQEQAIKASFGHQERPRLSSFHDHSVKFEQGKDSVIATVAYMIIFGDGLHNFIDGLSIGAAFNENIMTGVSISIAVLCEELPHELGDFAVLLNAGMSVRQALTYNFLSACTCYLGMAVGIFLGEIEASVYIFAVASGMFLYISLTDMVPEMNEIAEETSKVSVRNGIRSLLLQNMGLFTGITTLFLLAKYQDSIQF